MPDVYHNPKTGEVWSEGKTYPSMQDYQAQGEAPAPGPQQTSVPNLKDVQPAGAGMAAVHTGGNWLLGGLPDKIMAAHLASKYQIPVEQAQQLIDQHFAGGEKAMGPGVNSALQGAAMLPSFALAPEVKGAQGLVAAMHAVGHTQGDNPADLAKNAAGTAMATETGGALLGKAAEVLPKIAKAIGEAPGTVTSALLERFPRLRDYLSRNIVPQEQNAGTVAAMLKQAPGTYAKQIMQEGLQEPWTQGGRLEKAKANMASKGDQYDALLGDKSVPIEDIKQAMTPESAEGLVDAPGRLKSELGDLAKQATKRSPDMQAKFDLLMRARQLRAEQGLPPNEANEAALAQMGPSSASVPAQRVNDRIAKVNDLLQKAYAEGGSSGDIQAYHAAKTDLEDSLSRAGVDMSQLKPLNQSYAINQSAGMQLQGREMASGSNPPGNRYGFVRKTVQTVERPAARTLLNAYAKRHNNPASTLPETAKLAEKANPAVGAAITQAMSSGNPLDAAVELYKAGADQDVREAINPASP